jgi:sigma-B regulation protein RsbU (phosphoserine phosphatase)
VTLIYGVLHIHTGRLEMCNAGHPPPYLITADGEVSALGGARNPAFGLAHGFRYQSVHYDLKEGERLFLYTDGVTEAMNRKQELFTAERLEELLRHSASKSVEEITQVVISAVRSHSGNQEPSDDLTVLAVRMAGVQNG